MLNIRSQTKNKILSYFFLNEETPAYACQLARLIEADPKNVHRALLEFEEQGILLSEFKGRERYFHANNKNPFYKGYKEIFLKTAGLDTILGNKIRNIHGLKEAYIFGSYANKKYNAQSDIDILLVGEHSRLEVQRALYKIQKEVGREINVVNLRPKELEKRKAQGDQFIKSIFTQRFIKLL